MKAKENKLVLGTVQFGLDYGINNQRGKPNTLEVKEILDCALEQGIHLLDTAEAYGNAQEVIGFYHRTSNSPFRFDIITKFDSTKTHYSNLVDRVKDDMKQLEISSIYAYMYHSFDQFVEFFDTHKEEIEYLKQKGLIKKFGVSVYTNEQIEYLLKYDLVELVQIPYNLLDNENLRGAVMKKAAKKGLEVHTRSAFLQGLFFKSISTFTPKIQPLTAYLQQIRQIANSNNIEMADLALSYVVTNKHIDKALIGIDSIEQLLNNVDAANSDISPSVLASVNEINVKEIELLNPSNWN